MQSILTARYSVILTVRIERTYICKMNFYIADVNISIRCLLMNNFDNLKSDIFKK